MYEKKMDCPELELIVRVININTGAIINKKSLDNEKNDIINESYDFDKSIRISMQVIPSIHGHTALNFFLNVKHLRTI